MLPANASRGGTLEVDQHGVGNYTCIGVSKHGVAVTSILFNGKRPSVTSSYLTLSESVHLCMNIIILLIFREDASGSKSRTEKVLTAIVERPSV